MIPSEEPLLTPDDSPEDEPELPPLPSPSLPSPSLPSPSLSAPRVPSLRSNSDPPLKLSSSSPLGIVANARQPPSRVTPSTTGSAFSLSSNRPDIQARLAAFQASRMGAAPGGSPAGSRQMFSGRPQQPPNWSSAPTISGRPPISMPKQPLSARRAFPGALPGSGAPPPTPIGGAEPMGLGEGASSTGMRKRPHPGKLPPSSSGSVTAIGGPPETMFDRFKDIVDKDTGSLKFAGKAVLHGHGIEFSSGTSFKISLDEIQKLEELGKGNYGTVYKVIHRRKAVGRRGSITGFTPTSPETPSSGNPTPEEQDRSPLSRGNSVNAGGVTMAMKEIRLELDEAKFQQIIMELEVLHKCRSPYIIDFYGAFFQEGAVYICMEHMDGGSIDKLYRGGIPEGVLRKIAHATIVGLKTLKEDHDIIHRDVKPTNILVNTHGDVKLCDFGVSGNLVASIAKTNIGCQSYMAPERIASGGTQASLGGGASVGTYGVQSDIWSLGLSILECAMGCYPYPPETYNNIFSQLSAIVDGEPPDLPEDGFTPEARDFVRGCLHKIPKLRPTYPMLLQHVWIADLTKPDTISEESEELEAAAESGADFEAPKGIATAGDEEVRDWVIGAMDRHQMQLEPGLKGPTKPALHAAPLDAHPTLVASNKGEGPDMDGLTQAIESLRA